TPTFLVDKFQYDLATAGLNGTIFIHLASALTVPLMGYVADRAALRWPRGRIIPQAAGLLLGSIFVAWVGMADSRFTLIIAMTLFGICKGAYDSGIFASLFDVIPARSRGTAAGLMNTVGWGGGALGPFFTGWFSEHGPYESRIDNMSAAISSCSALYLASGIVLAIVCWRTVAGRRNGNAGDELA
ncbi:MAG: putative galactarate transporter, partial [Planctomycetota bacterium]